MAKDNQSDDWEESLKAVEAFDKKLKDSKKSAQQLKGVFSNIATELFGISGSAFFEETRLSIDELIKKEKELARETDNLSSINKKMTDDMSGAFGGLESNLKNISHTMSNDVAKAMASIDFVKPEEIKSLHQVNKLLEDENRSAEEKQKLQELQKEYIKDNASFQEKNKKAIEDELDNHPDFMKHASEKDRFQAASIISQGGFNSLVEDHLDLSGKVLRLSTKRNGLEDAFTETQMESQIIAGEMNKSISTMNEELKKGTGETFSLKKGFQDIAKNLASGILPKMFEFDRAISDAGKDFGFVQDQSAGTALQMANLNMEAARFGMSSEDTLQMMGGLGDELKTIDQKYLANSVEHFVAIQKATGISSQEVTTIAGEMMRAGKSAGDVEQFMEGANKTAKMFGVNTKKILQGVARNVDKMRQMGFQGGEESLVRMAATAERLNMNMDEMFDVAKKARTIEGAMDMAAELQLAGGSFANIDPMSLLAAARKGPEELQKILTTMGGDIGTFNKETGALEFDAIDADRLQMVADATGQTVDSIQKGLMKSAETNSKIDLLGLDSTIGDEQKNFIADLTNMEDGAVTMDPELSKLAAGAGISLDGVDSLDDLNQEQIEALMKAKADDVASLEEQAEQNQSFKESMTALKDSFMNIFTVFEPFIKWLTSMVQWLNGSTAGKWVIGLTALAFVAIPKMIGAFGKFKEGTSAITKSFKGMKDGKGVFGKIKGALGGGGQDKTAGDIKNTAQKGGAVDSAKGSGGGLKSLAEGLKAMGDKDVFKGIGAVALAGPALLLMLPGIPTVLLMGLVGLMGPTVELGFRSLANGIAAMGKAKGIWKGLAVMALVGIALIPFAYAASLMAEVNWLSVLAGVGVLALVILGLMGLGALLMGPQIILLLIGIGTLIMVGAGLLIFGLAMQQFAQGAEMMQGLDFSFISELGAALWEGAPGLIFGGLALALATPGLMIGAMGLMAIGLAAKTAAGVDWTAFEGMGDTLLGVIPGLLGFSLASLIFLNPVTLLGMIMMIGTLGMLAVVMGPLSESLSKGTDGLDRLADGLTKLQAAANSLDLEKLDALKSLSFSMAIAGLGGGILGDQIDKVAEALAKLSNAGSGGGKGGGAQKIQIDLKLNGRDLQSIIVDDTEIVS